MTPRDRLLTALEHREPDRVPHDLGSTHTTGIHNVAYARLRRYLGLPGEGRLADPRQGLAIVDDDIKDHFSVDAAIVASSGPDPEHWVLDIQEVGEYLEFEDEFGMRWRQPREGGLYFDLAYSPLRGDITVADIEAYPWPDPRASHRFEGVHERALGVRDEEQRGAVGRCITTGVFELASWMRGHEQFFMDMLMAPALAEALLEKAYEMKYAYWEEVFKVADGLIDVTYNSDDYGTQRGMFISPDTWRELIKPRLARLNEFMHANGAKTFLHSCGGIREIIPDLIDAGVDALNPVQVSADGMDTHELKQEFGSEIVFWGGGVDTQRTLPRGSPDDVREEVKRRLDDLMPGGGFVFTPVHNVQADVPPENIVAMWEAVESYGDYA